jgi:hypothetical protein
LKDNTAFYKRQEKGREKMDNGKLAAAQEKSERSEQGG